MIEAEGGPPVKLLDNMFALVLLLCTLGFGHSSRSHIPLAYPTIATGEVGSKPGEEATFPKYWIYGNLEYLSASNPTFHFYQEKITNNIVTFTRKKFAFDAPAVSINCDSLRKLTFSRIPEKYGFLAFDSLRNPYGDVESLKTFAPDIQSICLMYSKDPNVLEMLRSQALSLMDGTLSPSPLPVGSFLACATVDSTGTSEFPDVTGYEPLYLGMSPWLFRWQNTQLVKATGYNGLSPRSSKIGMCFGKYFAFGSTAKPVTTGGETLITDGLNRARITSKSITFDNIHVSVDIDTTTGLAHIQRPTDFTNTFSFFTVNNRGKLTSEFGGALKASAHSYMCFGLSPEPQVVGTFRHDASNFLKGSFSLLYLPPGSLLLCVQVMYSRTKGEKVPKVYQSPSSTNSSPGAPIRTTRKRKNEDSFEASNYKSLKTVETSDVYLSISGDNHQEYVVSRDEASVDPSIHSHQNHYIASEDHYDPKTFATSQNNQDDFLPIYSEDHDFDQLLRDIIDS